MAAVHLGAQLLALTEQPQPAEPETLKRLARAVVAEPMVAAQQIQPPVAAGMGASPAVAAVVVVQRLWPRTGRAVQATAARVLEAKS